MKKKKNKKLKLVISIIVLILILFALIKVIEYLEEENLVKNHSNINSNVVDRYLEENNVLQFSNFEKIIIIENISVSEVTEKIDKLVKEEIPELYKNVEELNEEKLKEYYNDNKKTLLKGMYLKTEDDFVQVIKSIKDLNCDLNDYKYCEYVEEKSDIQAFDNADRFLFTFNIYYKNNEYIELKVEFIKYHN